jgi:hypothetical protein
VTAWPTIHVVMSCYDPGSGARAGYARRTLRALVEGLRYSGALRLVVADDGSAEPIEWQVEMLREARNAWNTESELTRAERYGIGGSLNLAMSVVDDADVWLYVTDDWVLTSPLNLDPAVTLMVEDGYEYVRLLPIHPNLSCFTMFREGVGWWLHLFPHAGGFTFGTRPFLMTKRAWLRLGRFVEQRNAYDTEQDYAERVTRDMQLKCACLIDLHGPWSHIGDVPVGRIEPTATQQHSFPVQSSPLGGAAAWDGAG